MDPEQLQQHLLLKNRARMIPDKKKQLPMILVAVKVPQ
jgi:hypothetical protein